MKEIELLIVAAWILFGILLSPFIFTMLDLFSGIRKAKKRGELITSYGFRRTVDKLARYYNVMFAVAVIDCLQISLVWFLDSHYGHSIPIFPILTLFAAIGVGIIEVKSIFEKGDDKVKYKQVTDLFAKIAANKKNPEQIIHAISEYLYHKENKEEKK